MNDGDQHHQPDQDHRQGAGQVRVQRDVTGDHRRDADRQHVEVARGQVVHRGVGAQGIGQEDDEGAEQGRGQHRQADVAPEVPGAGAEQRRRLAPVLAQGVEGGVEQQHAQGNLEVGVEDDQAVLRVEVEAVDQPGLDQQQGQRTVEAEQDDEGEGQRHAGEVAGHVGEGDDEVAQLRVHLAQRVAAEDGDGHAEQARPEGDLQAVLDRLQVELGGEDLLEIAQAPAIGAVQAVDRHPHQRRDLEHQEEHGERQQAQQR